MLAALPPSLRWCRIATETGVYPEDIDSQWVGCWTSRLVEGRVPGIQLIHIEARITQRYLTSAVCS